MTELRRYAIVDKDGLVDNVVLWDGIAAHEVEADDGRTVVVGWSPPEGSAAVELADDHPAQAGDTLDAKGNVAARPEAEGEPTVEDRLAALEAQLDKG